MTLLGNMHPEKGQNLDGLGGEQEVRQPLMALSQ